MKSPTRGRNAISLENLKKAVAVSQINRENIRRVLYAIPQNRKDVSWKQKLRLFY